MEGMGLKLIPVVVRQLIGSLAYLGLRLTFHITVAVKNSAQNTEALSS